MAMIPTNGAPDDNSSADDAPDTCIICGEDPDGAWPGATGPVGVCYRCALEDLPGLIAEAVTRARQFRELSPLEVNFQEAEDEIRLNFWKQAAAAMAGRFREATDPQSAEDLD
jgi:hypothetical protein